MLKDIARAMLIGVIVIGGGYLMAVAFMTIATMAGLWYACGIVGWLAFVLFVAAFLGAGKDLADVAADDLEHQAPVLDCRARDRVGDGQDRRQDPRPMAVRPLSPFYDQYPVRSFDQPAAKGFKAEPMDRRAVDEGAIRHRQVKNLHELRERSRRLR